MARIRRIINTIKQDEITIINAALDEIKDLARHIDHGGDAAPDIAICIEVDKIKQVLGRLGREEEK